MAWTRHSVAFSKMDRSSRGANPRNEPSPRIATGRFARRHATLTTPSRTSASAPAKCSKNDMASSKASHARACAVSSLFDTGDDAKPASKRAMFEGHDAQIASPSSHGKDGSGEGRHV